ncbi:MAG TPA: Uma2 family endonuclease [Pseudonocardiaceae bacterium]|nr:Uma2 family endonuclease [Pseudonocardiaceae bacterium]
MFAQPADCFLPHPEKWTVEDLLRLPEDQGNRIELVDGLVVVSPSPNSRHQRVLQKLQVAFIAATPPEFETLPGVNVVLNNERLLIPDLVVLNAPGVDAVYYKGSDVLLALEIHSPSTRTFDLALKRQLYAEAGIPFLMFVDPKTGVPAMRLLELDGEGFREIASSTAGVLTASQPFPLKLDLVGAR